MTSEQLDRYARLLVEQGVSLRPRQPLFLRAALHAHHTLALRIAEAAYDVGGGPVHFLWFDAAEITQLIRRGRPEDVLLHVESYRSWYNDVLRTRGAFIQLAGREDPTAFATVAGSHPEAHTLYLEAAWQASKLLVNHGVYALRCPAAMAAAPTPAWARRVYPELEGAAALERLWDVVLTAAGVDQSDGLARAAALDQKLQARCQALNSLGIREIHVRGGGNDFRVGLSERAYWQGASLLTADHQRFRANIPSLEVFTTPDCRLTEGTLRVPLPFASPGDIVIEGVELEFRAGQIVDAKASRGEAELHEWFERDPGLRWLGEFALVGLDSPLAAEERCFHHRLLDENARAHVALGAGLPMALAGSDSLTRRELDDLGFNRADHHLDVTFGSAEVDVIATRCHVGSIALLEGGRWSETIL